MSIQQSSDSRDGGSRVVWFPGARYRSFYVPSLRQVSVVSSHLVEQAVGRKVEGGLLLVLDLQDGFCDLELTLEEEARAEGPEVPSWEPVKAREPLETYLVAGSRMRWFVDETSGFISLTLEAGSPNHWYELDQGSVHLGVSKESVLQVLLFRAAIDPSGGLQSEWLDQIEKTL